MAGVVSATAGSGDRPDVFVSYTAADRAWAEWISLAARGGELHPRGPGWDFRAGSDFVVHMRNATSRCHRTVAVLSANYLRSNYAVAERGAAFAADPSGSQAKLVPVRVGEFTADGLDRVPPWPYRRCGTSPTPVSQGDPGT